MMKDVHLILVLPATNTVVSREAATPRTLGEDRFQLMLNFVLRVRVPKLS